MLLWPSFKCFTNAIYNQRVIPNYLGTYSSAVNYDLGALATELLQRRFVASCSRPIRLVSH